MAENKNDNICEEDYSDYEEEDNDRTESKEIKESKESKETPEQKSESIRQKNELQIRNKNINRLIKSIKFLKNEFLPHELDMIKYRLRIILKIERRSNIDVIEDYISDSMELD